jgi:COP9 signalosome complex subunit 7
MEQTRALNALEPFIALSKSANSPRAAADLIAQATSAQNTYVFAELLQTPNIQALRSSDAGSHAAAYKLLEIFAWGTYSDYKGTERHNYVHSAPYILTVATANQSDLPPLSPAQHQKLLLLSLLPLAHSHATLTYAALLSHLDLPSTHALEQLVTTAIYAGLITATLDPAHELVNVSAVAPLRDLAPGSVPQLKQTLQTWEARCDEAVKELEARVKAVRQEAVTREKEKRRREKAMEVVLGDANKETPQSGQSSKRANQDEDLMELDEQENPWRPTRKSKMGGGSGFGSFQGLGRKMG